MCYEDNFFSFLGSVLGKVGGRVGAANCWLCESARMSEESEGKERGNKTGKNFERKRGDEFGERQDVGSQRRLSTQALNAGRMFSFRKE